MRKAQSLEAAVLAVLHSTHRPLPPPYWASG